MNYNGNMIKIARESRLLTQAELAEKIDLSQVVVCKIEADLYPINENLIEKIANSLSYPIDFFKNETRFLNMGVRLHRKRSTMNKREEGYIDAFISICTMCVSKLMEYVNLEVKLPEIQIDEYRDAFRIADELRDIWDIPRGCIKNLTAHLEKNGVFIFEVDYPLQHFDAVSTYNKNLQVGIIVINKNQPPDRYRFTLAHELGHIIMHRNAFSPNLEQEANNFASAFLMPDKDIYDHLVDLKFWDLAEYKEIWQVSMASLIHRAYDLGAIDKKKYTSLNVRLSQLGYKKIEPPCGLIKERPNLFKDLLAYFITNLSYSEKDLLTILNLFREDYIKYFDLSYNNNFSPKIVNMNDYKKQ